jgi:hypothetical protein
MAPPDTRTPASGSVEVGLNVGCVAFDFENDVCGEEESCKKEGLG